ncbi:MAG: L-methionine (R)-S-oxide reductase [Alteromonadaceae bacterium]|jgi:L-methionine (R)-S-oxide reductase
MSSQTNFYHDLTLQAQGLLSGESNLIANMANLSALIFNSMEDINWAGFYLVDGNELVLGPFQGQPACIRIPMGKGVCGTCASTGQSQMVDDVHGFDGHISCDAASNSELVIPFFQGDEVVGVLDIDSPSIARFNEQDKVGMQNIIKVLVEAVFD